MLNYSGMVAILPQPFLYIYIESSSNSRKVPRCGEDGVIGICYGSPGVGKTLYQETIRNRVLTNESISVSPSVLFPVCQDADCGPSLAAHHFQPGTRL